MGGSSPLTFIRSSNDLMVFQRPELSRMAGMPSRAASPMHFFVWSTASCRSAASGDTKSWWIESMGRDSPCLKAACLSELR